MFMNSSLDPRIESVIPILNKLNKTISENQEIKEVVALEAWADDVAEGVYSHDVERAFPNGKASGVKSHPAVIKTNKPIGTRVSDIGKSGKEHNVKTDKEWDKQKGMAEGRPEDLPGIDYDRPGDTPRKKSSREHNPYPFSKEDDDEYFNDIFRKKREAAAKSKEQGVSEDIGPQQAAVGQLGATAKVNAGGTILGNPERSQKGLRGKLVGASESIDPVLSRIKRLSGL
jgi:hypothetical protein